MPLPTLPVKNGAGADAVINTPNSGRQNAADSQSMVLANEDFGAIGATNSAPAADETANVGLNGLLKGVFATLRARLPALIGGSLPVRQNDQVVVNGPAAQSAVNVDLVTGLTGNAGWYDALQYQNAIVQIIASAGITAGAIIFEQTNDPASASAGVPMRAVEVGLINANPNVAAITIAASTQRAFRCQVDCRYFRIRISTAFVGGTVQAITMLSQQPGELQTINAQQAAGANFNCTAVLGAGTAQVGQASIGGIATAVGSLLPARITAVSGFAKATAGRVYAWNLINTQAAPRYLQLYQKATAGVPGTDTPFMTIPLPANGQAPPASTSIGVAFTTGVAWAITTDAAGTTIGAAGDVVGTLSYQ